MDTANPGNSKVDVTIPIDKVLTTVPRLDAHLKTPDFFDAAKFPTAKFVSTKVTINGTTATIAGDLTLKDVTKPVVLTARFIGAGNATQGAKKLNFGFAATTSVKRSDFGINYALPGVSDKVDLDHQRRLRRTVSDTTPSADEEGRPGIGRVEAFSDGVVAIIVTIMVLELHPPVSEGWDKLWTLWPVFLAYVLSYAYVAIYWVNHHRLFTHATHVTNGLIWSNMLLLFALSLVPFSTSYLGEHHFQPRMRPCSIW